jgi:hypothetical protein
MSDMLPSERSILAAFLAWLNASDGSACTIEHRPDELQRNEPACDFICADAITGRRIAVEISTFWRNDGAGQEDHRWEVWRTEIARLVEGRLPGTYHLATPLGVPQRVDPAACAEEIVAVVRSADWGALGYHYAPCDVGGMECRIWRHDEGGSSIEFQRFAPP